MIDFGDFMRAIAAMPANPKHSCNKCFGIGAEAVMCCDGRECGCMGQPVDYKPCECGLPFPTEEEISQFIPATEAAPCPNHHFRAAGYCPFCKTHLSSEVSGQ